MNALVSMRSIGSLVALTLSLVCGQAHAVLLTDETVTIGGFADSGSLTVIFSGDTMGGLSDTALEQQTPSPLMEVTAFSATYTDGGTLGTLTWGITDLFTLFYDTVTSALSISATKFGGLVLPPPPGIPVIEPDLRLEINTFTTIGNGNQAEIAEITPLGANLLASSPLPQAGVPAPASVLLLGLGLLLIRLVRR